MMGINECFVGCVILGMPKPKSKNKARASPSVPAQQPAAQTPRSESSFWGESPESAAQPSPGVDETGEPASLIHAPAYARPSSPQAYTTVARPPNAVSSGDEIQRPNRASPRSSPLRVTHHLREIALAGSGTAAQASDATVSGLADADWAHENATALIGAASDMLSSKEGADSGVAGDLGFTVYASLSGDYCVDFVPPAVDLSVNVSDRLMEVDGVSTRGKSPAEVVNMMRGRVGSYAAIKLFRFPPNGSPFFVETSLLRLPVLSDELRASMYPNYKNSRKAFADIHATKPASRAVASSSSPPASEQPTLPASPPVAAASDTDLASSSSTNVSLSKTAPSLQMESIHVWTRESLSQVRSARPHVLKIYPPRFPSALFLSCSAFMPHILQLWRWTVVAAEKTQVTP
jgi:hypothetical protein